MRPRSLNFISFAINSLVILFLALPTVTAQQQWRVTGSQTADNGDTTVIEEDNNGGKRITRVVHHPGTKDPKTETTETTDKHNFSTFSVNEWNVAGDQISFSEVKKDSKGVMYNGARWSFPVNRGGMIVGPRADEEFYESTGKWNQTAALEPSVLNISWVASAEGNRGKNGRRFRYICEASADSYGVWGTVLYTDDSSICTAALHAGLISKSRGGRVTIEIRPGATNYQGSTRNGISSDNYGAWGGSFIFVQ